METGRIDGVYTLKKNYYRKTQYLTYQLSIGDSFVCSEIVDGMVKIFITNNTNLYLSVKEFYMYFYDVKELRHKKIKNIMKKSGLCVK